MPKDVSSLQSGQVQTNGVNDPSVRVIKGKNSFPQSFVHPSTCSYGFIDPVAVAKCERGDVYPYKFVTDLNTFTLASPLKSKVKMYSSAFKVPMKAIYPRNWDIMMPIPNKGDDVPSDTRAILSINSLATNLKNVFDGVKEFKIVDTMMRCIFILESIFSDGGIFSKMNMHFSAFDFHYNDGNYSGSLCFDDFFDQVFIPALKSYFSAIVDELGLTGTSSVSLIHYDDTSGSFPGYTVTFEPSLYGRKSSPDSYFISFERALEMLRSGDYFLRRFDNAFEYTSLLDIVFNFDNFVSEVNIEPIISYQLACSHFFNNPKIDFIYSSDLYRDNMESLQLAHTGSIGYRSVFDWNGISKLYDVFSKNRLLSMIDIAPSDDSSEYIYALYFWQNLFNFQNSLRYGDYFTGAHPEPIAPGDISAPVIDGSVNALDMTKKLQMARLLNKVNISGPRMADYLRALWGGQLPEVPDDVPVRLSKEEFNVSGFEVNNTGSAQLSEDDPNITTTNLRLDDSRYMFEANIDMPCWIVVVQYFEAHRIYSKTMDRFAYHFNRFDDFLPDLQFIGDQDVKSSELDVRQSSSVPFAYNLRYMEYKQRYSYASGGFIRRLKSWAFITDNKDGNPMTNHITPEYIRSSPSEFDRFYKSLTGYSLGTRYHFITFNTNVAVPYRQMVYAPEILA